MLFRRISAQNDMLSTLALINNVFYSLITKASASSVVDTLPTVITEILVELILQTVMELFPESFISSIPLYSFLKLYSNEEPNILIASKR